MRRFILAAAAAAALTWPTTSQASAFHPGPRCRTAEAPVLCMIRVQRERANVWRVRAGSSRLRIAPLVYREKRPGRLRSLKRWRVRVVQAHGFYTGLWSWYASSGAACVHGREGSWTAYNPAGPYYGGFQMDAGFMASHGARYLRRFGDARRWPATIQVRVTRSVVRNSGWGQWPNTAAACGLL